MRRLLFAFLAFVAVAGVAKADDQAFKVCTGLADPDASIKACGDVIARGSRVPKRMRTLAYILRGSLFRDKGEDDPSIADLNEALKLDPTFEPSLVVRGDDYRHKGQLDAAFADYSRAIEISPKYDEAFAERGEVYRARKDWAHALVDYNDAVRINPKRPSYYANRAVVRENSNDLDGAIADATTNIGLKPTPLSYMQRCRLYDKAHDFDRALADCDASLKLDANRADTYVMRSDVDAQKGDFDQAITDAESAIRIDPKNPYGYENRGDGLRGKGRLQDALAAYDKALEIDPNIPTAVASREQLRTAIAAHTQPDVAVTIKDAASIAMQNVPAPSADVDQSGRMALVVGNSAYTALPRLGNPSHDAEDLGEALKGVGFEVTLAVDADRDTLEDRFSTFAKAARHSKVALIYFAGHGLQFNGTNYIVPTDARVEDETDLRHLIPVQSIIEDLENAPSVRLLILDACRETGVIQRLAAALPAKRGVAVKRGLVRDEAIGTFIAYSTQSGSVADDGSGGRNSPFARALLHHLTDGGIDVRVLFTRVRGEVYKATDGQQNPEVSDSLVGEFSMK